MKRLALLFLLAVLGSCSYDFGMKIVIIPKKNITSECFVKAIEDSIPDIRYEDDTKTEFHHHFKFEMSEDFRDKLEKLDVGKLERRVGAIEASFRLNEERITEIVFSFMYDDRKIQKLSAADVEKVKAFAKPYLSAVRALPKKLNEACGLDAKKIDIQCTGKICD